MGKEEEDRKIRRKIQQAFLVKLLEGIGYSIPLFISQVLNEYINNRILNIVHKIKQNKKYIVEIKMYDRQKVHEYAKIVIQ